ncbi:MAG: ATP-binding protein [Anaeromyxobacter sp.]
MVHSARTPAPALATALALALAWTAPAARAEEPAPGILILNSYHRGFTWTDGETDGALAALRARWPEAQPVVLNLDRKRFFGPEADALDVARIKGRLQNERIVGVLTTDDAALTFVLQHPDLFGRVPVAYCGVNLPAPPHIADGRRLSGVLERVDLPGTVTLARALQPRLRRVHVALDETETSAGVRPDVVRLNGLHPHIEIATLGAMSFAELETFAATLDPLKDALVLGSFNRDRLGEVRSYERVAERVSAVSRAPVYALWDFQLAHGVVGGAVLGGREQGHRAAELLIQLLAGGSPPTDAGAMAYLVVDAPVAERLGLHVPSTVDGRAVRILNPPEGAWDRYWPWILAGCATMTGLTIFSLALLVFIRALRRSERRFRELTDLLPQVVYEADRRGVITWVNRQAYATFGYDEIPPGMRVTDFLPPEELAGAKERVGQLASGGQLGAGQEYRMRRRDGTTLPVMIYSAPILRDGKPAGFRGLIIDVSDQKRAEAEREALRRRVEDGQRLESLGRLAGGVAHDFNNLLTPILGNTLDALEQLGPEHRVTAQLGEAVDAARRASDLVRQLLAFGRRQPLVRNALDLNAEITGFHAIMRRLIGEDVTIRLELANDLWALRGDPGQLQQVLLNLAANARDAMPHGGVLTFATRNLDLSPEAAPAGLGAGPFVELVVSDTGHGMAPEVLERVFEPFFTTKAQGRGTGLGLATVLGVVKQHGGDIAVRSASGQGTSFRVLFPADLGGAGAELASPLATPATPAPAPAPSVAGERTVLLAEDEPGIRRLIERYLAGAGYRVLPAEDGLDALRVAAAHGEAAIDLLLTDVVMPGLNGRDLCRMLRARVPGLRVLYMSGYTAIPGTQEDILSGVQEGFLPKPFDREQLLAKVGEALAG